MSQLLQAHLDCGDRDQLGWSQVVKAASGDTIWKLAPGEPAWNDRAMFLSHSGPQRDKGLMALDYERIRNVSRKMRFLTKMSSVAMERAGDYEVDAVGRMAVVVRKPKLRGAPADPPKVNRGTYTAAPNLLDHRPAIEGGVNASVHLKRTQPLGSMRYYQLAACA
ncbi:hypothetical protein EG328_011868 [Venturia inaequalis]|uniref:Uncharacterized protein n=1 Tax=Venturia inaequalis TaxID=5025 RepID=A0A8H3Z658_VENIN|nr:hypothetical protein EG328_011868 [Venturia inaequalis]